MLPPDSQAGTTTRIKASVARALIATLSLESRSWCILSGYDRLPEEFETDIDFMVLPDDFGRVPQMMAQVARQSGTQLFNVVEHELTGRAYFLGATHGSALTIVQPDCASDYSHFGRCWLLAEEVLAFRRWHPNGFWIPSAAHEFAYYLIKRVNKCDFQLQHGERLRRLYCEDLLGCDEMIRRFWKGDKAAEIIRMAESNDWSGLMSSAASFKRSLLQGKSNTPRCTSNSALGHTLTRILEPTGAWIAFMGPDGCGKSTILEAVQRELAPAFRSIDRYHLRPKLVARKSAHQGPVTDPHGQWPRGFLASIAKVLDLALDYTAGFFARLLPAMIRTRLVLFDRCLLDLLVDSKRIRYGGPQWLLRALAALVPGPDLVLLLDAPAEVLWSRKREVAFEEVVRQRAAYLEVARTHGAILINAAQPAEDVAHDALEAIVRFLAERAAQRLDLAETQGPAEAVPAADGLFPGTSQEEC